MLTCICAQKEWIGEEAAVAYFEFPWGDSEEA
jgi:hypothetical protein